MGTGHGVQVSALCFIEGAKENFTGERGFFSRTGESVKAKEVEGIPGAGIQGEGKSLDMLSHVQEFGQSVSVPHQPGAPPIPR